MEFSNTYHGIAIMAEVTECKGSVELRNELAWKHHGARHHRNGIGANIN